MEVLSVGEYTGDIIHQLQLRDAIITNTLYSAQKNNPDWHSHENLHICFVFQGGKAETRHRTQYTERNGSIFFYHAAERHRWISPHPISKSANIEIGRSFLEQYGLKEEKIKKAIEQKANAKALILKMQKELLNPDADSFSTIQFLLLELLVESAQTRGKHPPKWVVELKILLHDHCDQEMSLADLAQILQVHPVTISKYFSKYFSCTLGAYRRKLKIEKSIDLIKNTSKSLSEIAHECGFADQSHFIRNFKVHTGFLPKTFQKF
ncbi:MAG: AraC family transcriptional regulator [Bacteroidota bacterium]